MNLVALNSSPHKEKGGTAQILNPFLKGAEEAGANIELVFVHELDIHPCLGCFSCWLKTPGTCVQQDDMKNLLPTLAAADIVVFATPLYVDGMNGPMKMLVDRMIPLAEPFFEIENGHCRHPRRASVTFRKIGLVSVCGFHELDNFDPLVAHVKAICKNMRAEFAGAVVRPYATALSRLKQMGIFVEDIFEAAYTAGYQLVKEGVISTEILETVGRDIIPQEEYIEAINDSFQSALDALE